MSRSDWFVKSHFPNSWDTRSILVIFVIGLVAGVLGFFAAVLGWPLYRENPLAHALDRVMYLGVTTVAGALLWRRQHHGITGFDALMIGLAMALSTNVGRPILALLVPLREQFQSSVHPGTDSVGEVMLPGIALGFGAAISLTVVWAVVGFMFRRFGGRPN